MTRFWDALRPPSPLATIPLPSPTLKRPSVVRIASGGDADDAASRLGLVDGRAPKATFLLPEIGGDGRRGTSPFVARAVLAALARPNALIGMLRAGNDLARRWARLAAANQAQLVHLGASGWVRVLLDRADYQLTSLDVPSELVADLDVVGMLRAERLREPFEFWLDVVHPNTAFRALAGHRRDELVPELAAAAAVRWVLDLTPGGGVAGSDTTAILAVTDDVVAAELLILTAQQLTWLWGYEERGPWEHPRIQAACQLRLGVAAGYDLLIEAVRDDDPALRLAERVSRRLDCRVELVEECPSHETARA